jgi:hypothetical protein
MAQWQPPARSMRTGHRVTGADGRVPIPTREFPAWWWPFEVFARAQARAAAVLPPRLRDGYR